MTSEYFPPRPSPPTSSQIEIALRHCMALQQTATSGHDKRPFAALLLGPDNTNILFQHFSISHVEHAESELARLVSKHYNQGFLWQCTLVCTWEPCAMCSGTIYWANIGRVIYGASETKLKQVTGLGNAENFTMSVPCRMVLGGGQKEIEVIGPVEGFEESIVEFSEGWWRRHRDADGA